MKLAFDGQPLEKNPAGRGIYLLNLLDYLTNHGVFCYIFSHQDVYLNSSPNINKKNIKIVVDKPEFDGHYYFHNYFTWRKIILPIRLQKCDAQIFHQISNFGVPPQRIPQKIVLTVHDIVPKILPKLEFENLYDQITYESEMKESLVRAAKIIYISKSTKKDVEKYFSRYFSIKKGKVIYNGLNKFSNDDRKIKPKKFNFSYLICNAGFTEKKNTDSVIYAFALFLKTHQNFSNLKLIITGAFDNPVKKKFYKKLKNITKKTKLNKKVIFIGGISRAELGSYIKGASALLYLSKYEGFGFPPLEGMSLGCPVITSNISSMPEVVGKAAITVNPMDIKTVASKIYEILHDEKLRKKMVGLGLKQAKRFSWEKCAREIIEVYKSLLK